MVRGGARARGEALIGTNYKCFIWFPFEGSYSVREIGKFFC